MQSHSTRFGADAPSLTDGAQTWSTLCERLAQRARLDAEIVELTGRLQRSGTIEMLEGVTLDTALNLVHRLPGADRAMQLTAAEVLADMPATLGRFKAQELSWGQVRGIVAEARRLTREDRAALDARIDASADLFGKMDPDDAIDAVRVAAAELRDIRQVERAEERVERGNFVWGQPAMFGPGKLYGELDNLSLATVLNGIDAAAPSEDARTLSQRRADGLVALASHRCEGDAAGKADDPTVEAGGGKEPDGDGAAGRAFPAPSYRRMDPAAPAVTVLVDTRDVCVSAAGTIEIAAAGCLPTLTARAVEALAADAAVQVVLCDGGRPLAATRKVWARDIPRDVRLAVKARDRGDRFPGSRRPIRHVHHLDKAGEGHHPDFLLGTSEPTHRRIHRFDWAVSIDPPTGEVTFTRAERRWTTVPRGTRLRRPPAEDADPSQRRG